MSPLNKYTMMQYIAAVFKDDAKVGVFRDLQGDVYFECEYDRLYVDERGNVDNWRMNSFIKDMKHLDEETKAKYINFLNATLEEMIGNTLKWIG